MWTVPFNVGIFDFTLMDVLMFLQLTCIAGCFFLQI